MGKLQKVLCLELVITWQLSWPSCIYDIYMYIGVYDMIYMLYICKYGIYDILYMYIWHIWKLHMKRQMSYNNDLHLLCSEGQLSVVGTHLNDDYYVF